jgi:hypothetical protein
MLRHFPSTSLVVLVAVSFAACASNDSTPPASHDGGAADSRPPQYDSGPRDTATAPDGGGDLGDGGSATCSTTGGKAAGKLCKSAGECACPSECGNLYDSADIAGSCWTSCTTDSTACQSTELCVAYNATNAVCLTKGTITGTGLNGIAMYDDTPQLPLAGSANIVLSVAQANVTFSTGYGKKSSSGNYYFLFLYPGTANQPDITKQLVISCDSATWGAKSFDLADATNSGCHILFSLLQYDQSSGDLVSWTDYAVVTGGTMTLTAAPTGGNQPVTGTFAGPVEAVELIMEECGPNSTPC